MEDPRRPVVVRHGEAKDLRYKLQRPFKRALAGTNLEAEVAHLFETMPDCGLRLNLGGTTQVIAFGKAQS